MSSRAIPRVVVLKGGISLEKEISLLSGECCAAALRETDKYEVVELVADQSVADQLQILSPDVVFNSLHGRWGEDGCIQGILEWLKIPYTHSGVLSSSVCMNKEKTKSVYGLANLPCPLSISNPRELILSKKLLENTKFTIDFIGKRPDLAKTNCRPRVLPHPHAFVNPSDPYFLEIIIAREKPTALRRWASVSSCRISSPHPKMRL